MKRTLIALLGAALTAGVANAQAFIIDGSKSGDAYPASDRFQTNTTGFGDSQTGTRIGGGGSELDGVFAQFTPGFLNIIFTGNLEANGNPIEIFFDTDNGATGQNTILANPDEPGLNAMTGLTFDAGFASNFYLTLNIVGNGDYFVNYATMPTGAAGAASFIGGGNIGGNGTLTGGVNPMGLLANYDNSNIGGVTGNVAGGSVADAPNVTTGVEFAIPVGMIGNVSYASGVRISAFINGGGHSFLSNQVLGGLPVDSANLGGPANVNFANISGNQFFAVPEPASMAALALGFGVLARRRRAKK